MMMMFITTLMMMMFITTFKQFQFQFQFVYSQTIRIGAEKSRTADVQCSHCFHKNKLVIFCVGTQLFSVVNSIIVLSLPLILVTADTDGWR